MLASPLDFAYMLLHALASRMTKCIILALLLSGAMLKVLVA